MADDDQGRGVSKPGAIERDLCAEAPPEPIASWCRCGLSAGQHHGFHACSGVAPDRYLDQRHAAHSWPVAVGA